MAVAEKHTEQDGEKDEELKPLAQGSPDDKGKKIEPPAPEKDEEENEKPADISGELDEEVRKAAELEAQQRKADEQIGGEPFEITEEAAESRAGSNGLALSLLALLVLGGGYVLFTRSRSGARPERGDGGGLVPTPEQPNSGGGFGIGGEQ